MNEKNVTIRDVAEAVGVSIGTASRALKNQPGLSVQTRTEVLRKAESMGYDATKLRSAKPKRVLFLINRLNSTLSTNPFYSVVLQGVEEVCREEHVSLSLLRVGPADQIASLIRRHDPDALLTAGYFEPDLMALIKSTGLPLAVVDHHSPDSFSVNDDNMQGAWAATRHLIEHGFQRIALLTGPLAHYSVALRVKGFRKALFEAGRLADPELEVTLDDTLTYAEAGVAAMQTLLRLPVRPDAVFAYNDATAINAMRACAEAGLEIPRDIAFVGYDDIEEAAQCRPALSTVRVDKVELGRRAALQLIHGNSQAPSELLPVELLIRQSSLRS